MDTSALVHEFVALQRKANDGSLGAGERVRWGVLREALQLADLDLPPPPPGPGAEFRYYDGKQALTARLPDSGAPLLEVPLAGEVPPGTRVVVVVDSGPDQPARVGRARVIGPGSAGAGWVWLDLGGVVPEPRGVR